MRRLALRLSRLVPAPLRPRVPTRLCRAATRLFVAPRLAAVFDAPFYLVTNPDVAESGVDPLTHYLVHGFREGRNPSPLFDIGWYLATYPDVARAGIEPLQHYLEHGAAEGRDPSPLFSTEYYRHSTPGLQNSRMTPLEHFLRLGAWQGARIRPSPRHDPSWWTPPAEMLATVEATIDSVADLEPDLAALRNGLAGIPVLPVIPLVRDAAWRSIYRSLASAPRRIILVAGLEQPGLARLLAKVLDPSATADPTDSLLVVATDEKVVSSTEALPRGIPVRSFAEFVPLADANERNTLTVALIHALQPEAILLAGSAAGTSAIATHGAAIRSYASVFALTAGDAPAASDLVVQRARAVLQHLSVLYTFDTNLSDLLAERHRLPAELISRVVVIPAPVADRTAEGMDASGRALREAMTRAPGFLARQDQAE